MRQAAEALEFERASMLRDQYRAIEKVNEGQKVLHLTSENADVIAMAPASTEAWVEVFFVRHGKVVGRDNFIMAGTEDNTPGEILSAFVEQFYNASPYVPPRILLQHPLNDMDAIGPWLEQQRQGKVKLYVPQRGEKRKLVEMVAENAVEGLEQLRVRQDERGDMEAAVSELQEALNLPKPPQRIECYDISNIQGTNSVGSMVVFENGKPKTSHYRRFKVKSVEGIDDYSMIREVLTRRFKRIAKENETSSEGGGKASEDTWQIVPDLVLIDGGKGHLGAALQVLLELGVEWISLASLAKENEELFVPQMPEPIVLPQTSQALFLVQRARDEARRFAITYHRHRRSKSAVVSAMAGVPGIGPKRRGLLLRKFGSARGVREAPVEELAAVPGMTVKLATRLKEYL